MYFIEFYLAFLVMGQGRDTVHWYRTPSGYPLGMTQPLASLLVSDSSDVPPLPHHAPLIWGPLWTGLQVPCKSVLYYLPLF